MLQRNAVIDLSLWVVRVCLLYRSVELGRVVWTTSTPTPAFDCITSRSFHYASPHLWNQLPHSLRQPRLDLPLPDSSLLHNHLTSPVSSSPLLSSITPSCFFSNLKTFLFLIDIWHFFFGLISQISGLLYGFFLVSVFCYFQFFSIFSYRYSFFFRISISGLLPLP